MSQCTYQTSLESYYDGQARPELARQIESHLPTCAACSTELGRMAELSELLGAGRPEGIRPGELARLHEAVEAFEDRGILRLVVGLSAIAASILIISTAWLYDGPRPNTTRLVRTPTTEQTWERWASEGRIEVPSGARPTGTAMSDTTHWMIQETGGQAGHGTR